MTDVATSLSAGEMTTEINETAGSTVTLTIRDHYKAQFFGKASAGAARATIKPTGVTTLAATICEVDAAATPVVTDNLQGDVYLAPGDEVKLVVDGGATAMIAMRLVSARGAS